MTLNVMNAAVATAAVKINAPNLRRGWGTQAWFGTFRDIWISRPLIWRLFLRDFAARYRQSYLGVVWAVLLPLVSLLTFIVLSQSGVLSPGAIDVPYPLYALTGLTAWQVFAGGLALASSSITSGGNMVVKINFPKISLVIASLGSMVFEFLLRMVLVLVLVAIYKLHLPATALLVPLIALPIFALTLAFGMVLSLLNVIMRDVANAVTMVIPFFMFLTPVVFPIPSQGILATIMKINPVSSLVITFRDALLTGHFTVPEEFFRSCLMTFFFLLVAARVFYVVEHRVAERV